MFKSKVSPRSVYST